LLGMTSDNIARKVRHTLHMLPQDMYESNLTFVRTLNQLLEAIDRGSKVSFRYSRLGKQRISTGICFETDTKPDRVVSPYDIYMDNGKFYMVGFSDLHQALRSYRVDRIGLLRLTNEPWIPPTRTPVGDVTMALEAFFMNNTDNFLGQKRTVVTIRWDDSTHISVLYDVMGTENVFLISEEDNTFSIRSFENTGLINNLLRLGSAIEILEPASIRDQYLKIIDAIRAKY
jgi:predicted DNA-binding transcriptional regulator YafY